MRRVRVLIIGGGFSGLGAAHALLRAGIDDFAILEKGSELGGTWRDNTYPGCACDVPSQLYSFSFAPKADWSRVFAPQPEIRVYLNDVARRFGIDAHSHLDTEVLRCTWDDSAAEWRVETSKGDWRAQVLVAGTGALHEPRIPSFPGLERFRGPVFHTARWDHDCDLSGKRVAVVGTGSSAIQLVPEIQPIVEHLTVFQRTAPWVLPKPDHAIPPAEVAAFRWLPGFQKGMRTAIYYLLEGLQWAQRKPSRMKQIERIAARHLTRQVLDPDLRARLLPEWSLGCKRLLLSNTWYPAVQAPNVDLAGAVERITERGVVDASGVEHDVDVIVLGTGFHVHDPPIAARVIGRRGVSLADTWQGSPTAYLGTTVPGFPNLFFFLGPNVGNGHTSALVMIEAQSRYLVDALHAMEAQNLAAIEPRAPATDEWNDIVQQALAGTVWNAGGCASWYLDESGRNRGIYPWSTVDFRRRLRRFDPAPYDLRQRALVVAITGGAHGIGLATAEAFAARGATVCIGDLDQVAARRAAERLGGHALPLDVTDRASMETFVATIEDEVGPIELFVNNAGVMTTGRFLEETVDAEQSTMEVNYFGVANGLRAVLPRMRARRRGHVVNIASLAGRMPVAGLASYVASKHAVVGLSASVRLELSGSGVTLGTICPTAVDTRLASGISHAGLMAVEPVDVAEAVVESWETRTPEIVVPKVLGPLTRLHNALPDRVQGRIRRMLNADRVLTGVDEAARDAYEQDVLAS